MKRMFAYASILFTLYKHCLKSYDGDKAAGK